MKPKPTNETFTGMWFYLQDYRNQKPGKSTQNIMGND